MAENRSGQGYGVFEWINRHVWPLAAAAFAVAIELALLTPVVADDSGPLFDPSGENYDTQERFEELFSQTLPVRTAVFIVDAPDGGDVLTRAALVEMLDNQRAVVGDTESRDHLARETSIRHGSPELSDSPEVSARIR